MEEDSKAIINEEKSLTIEYFSTEIKQQLDLYRTLVGKLDDLQRENERAVERFVEEYKDQDKAIERKPIVDIYVYNMMYKSVASDVQITICKIQYAMQIAAMAFGFDSFKLSKEDKDLMAWLNTQPSNLFKLHQKKDGSFIVKMKDPGVYEIMTRRGYAQTPEDQVKLRQIWRHYYAEYNQFLKDKEAYDKAKNKEKSKEDGEKGTEG